MSAGDSAEDGDGRRREQNKVRAKKPAQNVGGIARRPRGEAAVCDRLDDEDEYHEQRPDENHGVHPPEA